MEPLTENNSNVEPICPKDRSTGDRVKLAEAESAKLNALVSQARASSKGFLALTKSDIVNFLIGEHKAEFSLKELSALRSAHYDPVKHMNWIMQALRAALTSGDMATVSALQSEIKGIELSAGSKTTRVQSTMGEGEAENSQKEKRQRRKKPSTAEPDSAPDPDQKNRNTFD